MTTPLAPCPGCGRDDGINHDELFEDSTWWRRNTCHCGWSGPTAPSLDTADAEWNRRAADAQTEALAQWMHARGIATGHGDAVADLLRELAREWDRRAPALRWRTEPPDVEGWWWRRVRDALLTAPAPTPAPKCDHTLHVDYDTGERWCERCGVSNPSVAPAPTFPRPCCALHNPSDGTRCQLAENHDGPCYHQPAPKLDRLRAENDALRARAIVAETRHAAESEHLISHGRSVERAAVVAWLHQIGAAPADVTSHSLHDAADSIVRGDHLAAGEKL